MEKYWDENGEVWVTVIGKNDKWLLLAFKSRSWFRIKVGKVSGYISIAGRCLMVQYGWKTQGINSDQNIGN